jgi:hypothetical protein
MAGFSRIFCVGDLGGFKGADGINSVYGQVLVGEGNRQWLEAKYFKDDLKSLNDIKVIIPEGPEHKYMLLDSFIVFFPDFFKKCPSFEKVKTKLKEVKKLDFNLKKDEIPEEWEDLRKEALPIFKRLNVFWASLKNVDLSSLA